MNDFKAVRYVNACVEFCQTVERVLADPAGALPHIEGQRALTPQERRAVALAVDGLETQAIGDDLDVSINTAGSYLKRVKAKTGLSKWELPIYILNLIGTALAEVEE